jgi:heme a synthase
VHNFFVDFNFTHTRFGAGLVSILVVWLAFRTLRNSGGERRVSLLAGLMVVLLGLQVYLGMRVIWEFRQPIATTLHVLNGAALFASCVLLAIRTSRFGSVAGFDSEAGSFLPSTRNQS